jgi:F-type H+-transporting ATPase subunit a
LFILTSNWIGAIIPWSLLELPAASGELSAPTNDINLTACLALITSHATFYTGFSEFGWLYPMKYFRPVAYLVPLNLLEEFSKPLSLSFRLLGNILADELTLAVLYGLVPIAVPIPVFLLGLFTSGIQALVFATLAGAYLGESIECLLE